jgi:ribonuclease E
VGEALEAGQDVLVQVTRDGIGRKGPALTGRISLPGRYLVLLTSGGRSGVSRRMGKGRRRDEARRLLDGLDLPEGMGVIVRTAGEDATEERLKADLAHLLAAWEDIRARGSQPGPPAVLRGESTIAERSVRDILPSGTSQIVVDRESVAEEVRALLETWYGGTAPVLCAAAPPLPSPSQGPGADAPAAAPPAAAPGLPPAPPSDVPAVVFHTDPVPLFHAYGVEAQLEDAFRRAVRLESGGSIVLDPTEALVAVDVNSGRFTGEEDPEQTALATNLEAAVAAARQLRLRDLGGLVVVDFIDLKDRKAARKVERTFRKALARDRARIRAGRIGPFGCLMLSRQRIRQALTRVTHEECPTCGGTGRRRHPAGLGLRVLREMEARVARSRGRGGLEVRVPSPVLEWLRRHRGPALDDLRKRCTGPVKLKSDNRLGLDGWAMKGLPPEGGRSPAPA